MAGATPPEWGPGMPQSWFPSEALQLWGQSRFAMTFLADDFFGHVQAHLPAQSAGHWLLALALNAFLIGLAQRLPLLTPAGWVHAAALGTLLWGCLGWRGWLAVVLYLLLGSLVTRLGLRQKQAQGLAEARGGRRGP